MYDFAMQFPRTPDTESISPRDAALLTVALSLIADQIRYDIGRHGSEPINLGNQDDWLELARFPMTTWRMSADWRTTLSGAADALIDDLTAGALPQPRCPAEEAVLYLAIEDAPGLLDLTSPEFEALPVCPHDNRWDEMYELLFQDTDIKALFVGREFDGIEDPADELNRSLGMGDYRAEAWFDWFSNVAPRRACNVTG
jgi:hypothetical protein